MTPSTICIRLLGEERLGNLLGDFSVPQIKAVLKRGGIKAKTSNNGFAPQAKRRKLWSERIMAALQTSNEETASELLQQWLLNHRRAMLIDYLDLLGIPHTMGETEHSFFNEAAADQAKAAADKLLEKHDRSEALAYLAYVAFQQESNVFQDWAPLATEDPPPAAASVPSGLSELSER